MLDCQADLNNDSSFEWKSIIDWHEQSMFDETYDNIGRFKLRKIILRVVDVMKPKVESNSKFQI